MKPNTEKLFLKESNAIEGVYDDRSLRDAEKAWTYLKDQNELTKRVVCQTHKILMEHQPLPASQKGKYRTKPAYVGNNIMVSPLYINDMMDSWINDANIKINDPQTLHVRYEKIHPFADGNGRTGRMFLNWHRRRLKLPILVIPEIGKYNYYKWFQ